MDSAIDAAKELYFIAKDDARFCSQIRAAYRAAVASGYLAKGGMDSIINASKNGSSMTMMQGISEGNRIRAMRYALAWVDQGGMPVSGRSVGRF